MTDSVSSIIKKILCQAKKRIFCNPSVTGDQKGSIRQEYFQSFIMRIVKILWAIIAIPIRSVLQGLTGRGDCVERFPL